MCREHSPTVVFGGIDSAVGEMRPSTDLRQTLGVEQGPGAAVVGGKFQADTDNMVRERKKKGTVSLCGRDRQVEIPPWRNPQIPDN